MDNEELIEEEVSSASNSLTVGLYYIDFNLIGYDITLITPILESCEMKMEISRVVNYTRDGVAYIQGTSPRKRNYEVVCYCTREQMEVLEDSIYYGKLLCAVTAGGETKSYGRPIEYSKSRVFEENNLAFDGTGWNEYYKMEITMVYETEPSTQTQTSTEEETQEET